jgi:hypothetical protein
MVCDFGEVTNYLYLCLFFTYMIKLSIKSLKMVCDFGEVQLSLSMSII